jgi:hypothetical protein
MIRRSWKISLAIGIGLLALAALWAASIEMMCIKSAENEAHQEAHATVPDIGSC